MVSGRIPRSAFLAAALASVAATAGHAGAHASADHGTLTIHEDPDGPATVNVAGCEFFVRGRGMEVEEGHLEIRERAAGSAGEVEIVTADEDIDGEPDPDGGFQFLAGPYEPDTTIMPHDMLARFTFEADGEPHSVRVDFLVFCDEPFAPCPEDLRAEALANGDIRLTWEASEGAESYNIVRFDEDGSIGMVANTEETTFTDTTSVPGETSRYRVDPFSTDRPFAQRCAEVEVTAIPFFGGAGAAALAAVGGTAGSAVLRRRR